MKTEEKKVTLGDLLQQKEDYEIHTFAKWKEQIEALEQLANKGDVAAVEVLFKIALESTEAVEKLVIEGKPPIRYLSAIAPVWPVNYNAAPQIKPIVPDNLGKFHEGPLALHKASKFQNSPARLVMKDLLLIIHYLREHRSIILQQEMNMAEGASYYNKVVTQVQVPGGGSDDVFEAVSYLQPADLLKYEFDLHNLVNTRFEDLVSVLKIPNFSKSRDFIFSYQEKCFHLPDDVDSVWLELAKKILHDLTDGNPLQSPLLYEMGKHREGRKGNATGASSEGTDEREVCTRIYERLDGAFVALCKNKADTEE